MLSLVHIFGETQSIGDVLLVLYVVQMKVCLRSVLKLIAMISLTSQENICVQCVTNSLQQKDVWIYMNKFILEISCICVLSVRNVLLLSVI